MSRKATMPTRRTVLTSAALSSATFAALAACSSATDGDAGGSDGGETSTTVNVAIPDEVTTLDPIMQQVLTVNRALFEGLTQIDADGEVSPLLASEWASNADATEWTFTLAEGATFSDGTPVAVSDVIWTYQTTKDSTESPNASYLGSVATMTDGGNGTLVIALGSAFAAFPRQLSLISILPQAAYEAAGADAFASAPVGSGPYTVESWRSGSPLELVANAKWWGGTPAFATATITTVPDEAARLNALQSGEIDAVTLAANQVEVAKRDSNLAVESTDSNLVAYLGFNVTAPGLDQLALRQAIDLAIDRDSITAQLLGGLASPIGQLVSSVTEGYADAVEPTAYDPDAAKQLVASSGYDGTAITFEYPTDGTIPQSAEVAQAIQSYLQEVGITVEMRGTDNQTVTTDWLAKSMTGMYMFSFKPSTLDAGLVVSLLYGPTGKGYASDATIDGLVAAQQAEADETARAADFEQIWKTSQEQAYYAPLFSDTWTYGWRKEAVTVTPRADGYLLFIDMEPASA
jgi:peptide/nickel transport system substrate-binding protein